MLLQEGGEPPPRHREAPRRFGEEPIHDGVNEGAHTWFTVVSGQVVQVDTASGAVVNRYDLTRMDWQKGRPMGWCRGIHREADRTLLAFSRLRPTTLKQNLAWLRKPLGKAHLRMLATKMPLLSQRTRSDLGRGGEGRGGEGRGGAERGGT